MRRSVEQHPSNHYATKRKRHPAKPKGEPEKPKTRLVINILQDLAPLRPDEVDRLINQIVSFRGQILPSNFVIEVSETDALTEGQRIGYVQPVYDRNMLLNPGASRKKKLHGNADPGQILVWRDNQVVSESARESMQVPVKPPRKGRRHR